MSRNSLQPMARFKPQNNGHPVLGSQLKGRSLGFGRVPWLTVHKSEQWLSSYRDNMFSTNKTINIHVFRDIPSRFSTSFVLLCWF